MFSLLKEGFGIDWVALAAGPECVSVCASVYGHLCVYGERGKDKAGWIFIGF